MSREEALLALERHATSKCISMEDLRTINTLGFRGEALPSIASVSRFTLRTRTPDEAVGTEITVGDGMERQLRDASLAEGSEVVVDDLFYNVPARRKFLKKDATEARAATEVVQRLALANHRVHFELVADQRRLLTAPPETDPMARIFAVLGKRVCEHLYECFIEGRISVSGFISQPDARKRGATGLYTFVNGRFVRDRLLIQAVLSGYSTLLGRGEYPWAVLHVRVPPGELDVNVHPTKNEVRFQRANEVFAAVSRAVRLTLSEAPWVAHATGVSRPSPAPGTREWTSPVVAPVGRDSMSPEFPARRLFGPPGIPANAPGSPATRLESAAAGSGPGFSAVTYLGQFANCYLLGQTGSHLVLVDQHAAHERVVFDRLCQEFEARGVGIQPLLVPVLLELEPALVAAAAARRELLARLGLLLEPFGGATVAVKGVPILLKQRSPEPAVRAVLEDLSDDEEISSSELFHKPISTMACHLAVRAGDPMAREEALALFRQMDGIDLASYCPHGRPVVVFFEEGEVARWFKRT